MATKVAAEVAKSRGQRSRPWSRKIMISRGRGREKSRSKSRQRSRKITITFAAAVSKNRGLKLSFKLPQNPLCTPHAKFTVARQRNFKLVGLGNAQRPSMGTRELNWPARPVTSNFQTCTLPCSHTASAWQDGGHNHLKNRPLTKSNTHLSQH